jgi:hypothetical protein
VEPRLRAEGSQRAIQLAESLVHYVPLVQQVMAQTTHRVLEGRQVAAGNKLVSLFEPHTAIIQRGKSAPNETEFGRKLWYSEVDGGLISEYRILKGNPPEAAQWVGSLQQHRKIFGHPPELATADRGVFSPLERRTGSTIRREASGTAATGSQEWSPAKTRNPAVVQSRAPPSQWDRGPYQWTQAGASTRPLSESRRERFGTLDRLGNHYQQFSRHGSDADSPSPFTQMIASGFPDEN